MRKKILYQVSTFEFGTTKELLKVIDKSIIYWRYSSEEKLLFR